MDDKGFRARLEARVAANAKARQSTNELPKAVLEGRWTVTIGGLSEYEQVAALQKRLNMPTAASVIRRALDELEKNSA